MSRILIFADEIPDRSGLIGAVRKITGEPIHEIREHVDGKEPLVDYDIYAEIGYEARAANLRKLISALDLLGVSYSVFEIPRLSSWRDKSTLSRHEIDPQTLVNILDQAEKV